MGKAKKIRFYSKEFDRILNDPKVKALAKNEAFRIKANCGEGFIVRDVETNWVRTGRSVRRAYMVGPNTAEAARLQAEEKVLQKAVSAK